jgi:hypothetical protein
MHFSKRANLHIHVVKLGESAHQSSQQIGPCSRTLHELRELSIDSCFQFLHGQSPDRLRSWLRFENARLLGERIHALASRLRGLLLQLQVKHARNLKSPVLLQLIRANAHVALHDSLHVLALQASGLRNRRIDCGRRHAGAG